jgi:hypothetical protein
MLEGMRDLFVLRQLTAGAITGLGMSAALLLSAVILATDAD